MAYIRRSKNKATKDYVTKDIYNYYKSKVDKPVSRVTFRDFLIGDDADFSNSKGIIPQLMMKVINENFEWKMPFRLGIISVKKSKPKVLINHKGKITKRVNFKASFEYWRKKYPGKTDEEIATIPNKPRIYHDNDETNGYQFKFFWDKFDAPVINITNYKLNIQRYFKRYLAAKVRDPLFKTDYFLVPGK